MPLVDMKDMVGHAYRNSYAVGAFEVVSLEFLEAIVGASERTRSPVILSLSGARFGHEDLEPAIAAAEGAARRAQVPVAVLFDRSGSFESAVSAINLGSNGVALDASRENFPTNVSRTRRVVEMAHACGVAVEGELGHAAGPAGDDAGEAAYTSVEEARAYVERTQVDFLAVSIGTLHGRQRGKPRLDCDRVRRINEAVGIPLVMHGETCVADDKYRTLVANGVAKINCFTALSDAAASAIRANSRANGARAGYPELLAGVREAIGAEVERCQRLFGAAGRAAEVLGQCQPWETVEHVIVFNVEAASDVEVEAIMARGREVLGAIPGVRRVFTGRAMPDRAKYRFCWLVQFTHPRAAESYRDHPEHLAFANSLFRPIAADRITIDFVQTAAATANGAAIPGPRSLASG